MKFQDTIGIIGLLAIILGGFFPKQTVSLFVICMGIIIWLIWATWELISLRKIVTEIELPENITGDDIITEEKLNVPVEITSEQDNCCKPSSKFLKWDKATIMIWVYITPKGEGIRDSRNCYILAHSTGEVPNPIRYRNRFSIGYMGKSVNKNWMVNISDNAANEVKLLEINDNLSSGWHHFLVSWDKQVMEAQFYIDLGQNGDDTVTGFKPMSTNWPEKIQHKIHIGSWMPVHRVHYCETEFAHFMMTNQYLDINDDKVKAHFQNKPI